MNSAGTANRNEVSGDPPAPPASPGFFRNVLWNWFGVAVISVSAFVLSPFIIRKLGDENYGLWSLTTSLVEYYWLVDFGLRSATVRFTAHYMAMGERHRIAAIVNTNVIYALLTSPLLIAVTWFATPWLIRAFRIEHPLFPALLMIVIVSWCATSILSVYTSALEGLQRFDITNQSSFISVFLRTVFTFVLLYAGYGVLEMAWATTLCQVLMHIINFVRLRNLLPEARFSLQAASVATAREMLGYGVHSLVASVGGRLLNQSPPLIISYMLPTRFVGYYSAPRRLLEFLVEGVARIGNVSNCRAAELAASKDIAGLTTLSVLANRYSLLLFLPLATFLMVYAEPLLSVWISPAFAAQSAATMVALLPGITVSSAAQYNSGSILFGMGKHKGYSRLLVMEALVAIPVTAGGIYAGGLPGGAWAASFLMIANRGLAVPWLLVRKLNTGFFSFLAKTYMPLVGAVPVGAALMILRRSVPGSNWMELILAGTLTVILYAPFAWVLVRAEDRMRLMRGAGAKLQPLLALWKARDVKC